MTIKIGKYTIEIKISTKEQAELTLDQTQRKVEAQAIIDTAEFAALKAQAQALRCTKDGITKETLSYEFGGNYKEATIVWIRERAREVREAWNREKEDGRVS